jgi:hypothetical protein
MPRAMPGPLLGEPWVREPHLARGELGHAAHQGRPRLGRARPCQAAAQAGRAEPPRRPRGMAAAPPRRRADWPPGCASEGRAQAARARVAPAPRPRAQGPLARAGAAVAEAACPAEIDTHPCRRGWLGPRPRAVRPPGYARHRGRCPSRTPVRRGAEAAAPTARRAGDVCSRQGVVPRPPAPGRRGRRGRALVAAAAAPWPLRAGEPRRAAATPLQGGRGEGGAGEGEGERRRGRERDVRGIEEGEKEVGERGWG